MEVYIIAIGDELLLGQVTDTNSGSIARMIDPYGWKVRRVEVVHDSAEEIEAAVSRAMAACDVVLLTGGLGPTKDDITKGTLARIFDSELHESQAVLDNVIKVMSANGRQLNDLTRAQAIVPDACEVIQNEVGTAPLMLFERDGKVLVSMPGVPHETLTMMQRRVLPKLLEKYASDINIGHRVALVADLSESNVAMKLDEWESALPSWLHLAYLPKARLIRLRLDGQHPDKELLNKTLDAEFEKMTAILGKHVIAKKDIPLAEVLVEAARKRNITLATAESCTGGNIAHEITLVAGCSDVMLGSIVSYANSVKEGVLGVSAETLAKHGAVSEETVAEMLAGAIKATGAGLAIATSGIAGPGGAVEGKPVGTVYIGAMLAGQAPVISLYHFGGNRSRVIEQATAMALTSAIHLLQE